MSNPSTDRECPACGKVRRVRHCDWIKRKSDHCISCTNRLRVGLRPDLASSGKGTRLYNIWRGLRQRCGLITGGHKTDLLHYAENGISVCGTWSKRFSSFSRWALKNGYEEHLVIDRKDNAKGYKPSNCHWVTITESNRNKTSTLGYEKVAEIRGWLKKDKSDAAIARLYGVNTETIRQIRLGKSWQ